MCSVREAQGEEGILPGNREFDQKSVDFKRWLMSFCTALGVEFLNAAISICVIG
jgi:hypothetical protein